MSLSRKHELKLINYAIERLISDLAIPGMKATPKVKIKPKIKPLKAPMSASARKAISKRMKAYWKKRNGKN